MRPKLLRYFIVTVSIFIIFGSGLSAQDFSNKGKDFWVGYGLHCRMFGGGGGTQQMVLYFATEAVTNITVEIPALGYSQTYSNIPANTIFTSNPLPKTGAQDARLTTEGISNKGIHITSTMPVVAYAHIYNGNVSGATILFPTNTLGREYYSMNYTQNSNEANSNNFMYAIATDTGTTTIEFIPSANTQGGLLAGQTYTYNLKQGEVFNALGTETNAGGGIFTGTDLTGSLIRSKSVNGVCKKIAVFSGAGKLFIRCASNQANSADNYMVQAFPKNAWGKTFLTVPTQTMPNNFFRIGVQDPTTVIRVNGVVLSGLINNFYYNVNLTSTPNLIESDKPIMVAQYITTQGACGNGTPGDPEVIYLSPVEQNISKVILNSTPNSAITSHYINVVVPNGGTGVSSFRIDGALPAVSFTVHPRNTAYSYAQIPVGAGQHTIQSDSGFNAIAYGFGAAETYGYNAGTNVKDLFQFVSTKNQLGTAPFPAACVNSPFNFSITFPYQPDSIRWTFNGLFPPVGFGNPVPDTSYVVSGRTIYTYRISAPYTITAAGNYPVKVYARNPIGDGCNNDQEIDFVLQVFNPPGVDFTWTSKGCVDSLISFSTTNNTSGRPVIKYFWDFGDGTYAYVNNPTKKYSAPGKYIIKYAVLTDVGCLSDTLSKEIEVTNTPAAKFGFTNPQCLGKQIVFGDSSKLTGSFGSIVNWNWNLGNGSTFNNSNAGNVSTTYPATNTYTATLQVQTNTGCISSVYSLPVKINPNPVPDFTNQYACLPDGVVNFTGTSTIADGTQNLFTYLWNFGDPSTGVLNNATTKDPSHKYATVGPYNVKLIVTSNNGCMDSVTKAVANIYPQPKTNFNAPAEVCYQSPVTFTDATNGITHPVTQWQWRFKNAAGTVVGSSNLKDPVFNFPAPGSYTVQHWAFTSQNCVSDTVEKQIIINPWPTAAFTLANPACERNQVTFTDNAVANAGTLVRWYWNLSDGTVINAANGNPVTHTYATWGTKNIKMVVESSKGCKSDTLRQQVLINPLPKPGVIIPEVCLQDGFATFIDTTKIADGSAALLKYLWTFNTGAPPVTPAPTPLTSTLKSPTIQFFIADNYQFNLVVESKDGCKDSINNVPFTINGVVANADFNILPTNGLCSNQDVEIQNKSTVVFGWLTKVEIYWDYANNPTLVDVDDNPVIDEVYAHRYPNFQTPLTKTFQVRLRAFSGIICVKDVIKTITVNASPLTTFAAMPGICIDAAPRQLTQAVETGGLAGNGVFTGPGVSSSGLFNPATAGVGTHTIRYAFTAANGCTHFSEQTIEVYPRPVAQLQAMLPNCEKNSIVFNSNGSAHNATSLTGWNWNFGDATPVINTIAATPVSHTYATYGNYTVNLIVTNNRGCNSLPQPLTITVHPLPSVNFDMPNICLPDGSGQFTDRSTIPDNSQATFRYKWDFGNSFAVPVNSDTSNLKNPVYKYSNLGPYSVKLIVTSNNNCRDSLTQQLVNVFPQPKAKFSTNKDSICIGETIVFTDESDALVGNTTKWKWSFGNGDSSFISNPVYRYPSPATTPYSVKLFVYSDKGCVSDTAEKLIDVWAYPVVTAGPDFTMLQDGVRTISDAKATGSGLQYLWSPSTYLNNVQLLNPAIVKPQDDITYTLTVTGRGGCVTDDEVFVKILKTPKPPNTFTPNGDGVNDFWEIEFLNDYPGCIIEVYNTAGSLVYRSVGYSTPWDGKFKGQALPAGTYYYVIDPKNGRSRIAGYVTILR